MSASPTDRQRPIDSDSGARLQSLRSRRHMTQIRVQIETGIDQSDYSKIERGERYPTYEQAIQLCRLFDTSMDYIYGLTDDPAPYPRSDRFLRKTQK